MAKKDLKASVEAEIKKMLESKDEPSEGRMKLLALSIKMCALNAKLEESDYGAFFGDGDEQWSQHGKSRDPGSVPKGEKPAGGKRANGGAGT